MTEIAQGPNPNATWTCAQPTRAVLCPVCNGTGKVPDNLGGGTDTKECHGCKGKGWVEVAA